MFKLSFDLPEPKQEKEKLKNRKERKLEKNVAADDLQDMFRQLGHPDPKKIEARNSDADSRKRKIGQQMPEELVDEPKKARTDNKTKNVQKKQLQEPKEPKEPEEQNKKQKKKEPKPKQQKSEPSSANTPEEKAQGTKPAKQLTPMQLKMQQKLSGGRFRWINEQLYTIRSDKALDLFTKSPEMFNEYHSGFRNQVETWPENPVDTMIKAFKQRLEKPLNAPGGLPSEKSGEIVVADMGCGEAQLALHVSKLRGSSKSRKAKFNVHSFDLHKANDRITVADIANVPLPNDSAHIVVFCLALMGTNTEDFIKEALRILKPYGEIWISEIKSRFDIVNNKTDTQRFIDKLKRYGLHFRSVDDSNKMFVSFQFVNLPKKTSSKPKFVEEDAPVDNQPLLKPCIYKKR